jgi:hypothetical protein
MTDRRITRRRFLARSAQTAACAVGSPAALVLAQGRGVSDMRAANPLSALEAFLVTPPDDAKPMTRWWWFGGAVTREEITRELAFMREAGLKGAEIQPVYPLEVDDPSRNIRHLRYFSPEWFQMLRHAAAEARRLGLQLDLTLGSGWPYGGPFIPTGLAARRIRVLSYDVEGPAPVTWHVASQITGDDRVIATVALPIGDDATPDVARAQHLHGQPAPATSGTTPAGLAVQGWSAPAGHWRVMLFLDTPTGMQVKRPTYGMEGLVLDHHNRAATELFLRAAGDRVIEGIDFKDGAPFTSIFCDSLEVYGADWTARLPGEFAKRRGYDLVPHLPALFGDAGPLTPHVRHDYHLTLSDLMLEEFFVPLVRWAEERGLTARVQAHGAMADVMRGYGLAHVPEGESIFLGDRYAVNLKHRRLASSAAHLYEKPIVSAESYTWLRTPLFTTTLEMMKALTDAMFLDGITQVVNHGYSYSPPEAGAPGWAFYASTEVNHTNTWWRHYPHLARYVQRASALLRQGTSVNRVGVYLPLADVYAEAGAGGLHIDVEVERRIQPELLDGLRRAGYDFDLLNDHALAERASIVDGELRIGTGRYAAVVVPGVRFMPPESAQRLAEFARAGGELIVIGKTPGAAPGVQNLAARSAIVRDAFARARSTVSNPSSKDAEAIVVTDLAAAIAHLRDAVPPDFQIVPGPDSGAHGRAIEHIGFTHRRAGEVDLYLVANVSQHTHDLRVRCDVGHRLPHRWNLETGESEGEAPAAYAAGEGGRPVTEVELRLDPFESCILAFGSDRRAPAVLATDPRGRWSLTQSRAAARIVGLVPERGSYSVRLASGRSKRVAVSDLPPIVKADGPWRLTLGPRVGIALDRLRPWAELEHGRGFSGWGIYETEVELPEPAPDVEWLIDLGTVHETAEVSLNGQPLGAAWKGTRRLACGDALVRGPNLLRVEVANLWIHHVIAHPPGDPALQLRGVGPYPALAETAGIRWGTYGEVPPDRIPPSGLLGPVRFLPMKRVSIGV